MQAGARRVREHVEAVELGLGGRVRSRGRCGAPPSSAASAARPRRGWIWDERITRGECAGMDSGSDRGVTYLARRPRRFEGRTTAARPPSSQRLAVERRSAAPQLTSAASSPCSSAATASATALSSASAR